MNCFGVVIVFAIATLQFVVAVDQKLDDHWEKYKQEHGKDYDNEKEEQRRREHFENHVKTVAEHNVKFDMGLVSYEMSVNHPHADKSYEELKNTILGAVPPTFFGRRNETDFSKKPSSRAASVDWRGSRKGRVTSVKQQGSCGSCWAFATVGALEGQFGACGWAVEDLSMEYLLDCASREPYSNAGCDGGWPASAMDFIKDNGGIPRLSDYPYQGEKTECPSDMNLVLPTTGKTEVGPSGNERAVATALENIGPLSAALHVSDDLMNYRKGIYESTQCKGQEVNHAVLLVGYGTENGKDFWIVKNSWGTEWGERGYFRIRRNYRNLCKIASFASAPTVNC